MNRIVLGLLLARYGALKLPNGGADTHYTVLDGRHCSKQHGFTNASSDSVRLFHVDATCVLSNESVLARPDKEVVVNYFPDTSAWSESRRVDVLRELAGTRASDILPPSEVDYLTTWQAEHPAGFQFSSCRKSLQERGEIRVESLGPFLSFGGYSWLSLSWTDAGSLSDIFPAHPNGIDVFRISLTSVDENGIELSNPPLHQHHSHVTLGKSMYSRKFDRCSKLEPEECLEQGDALTHGDSECVKEEGGTDCVHQIFPEGYAYTWRQPRGVWGDINDVRTAGSPPLQWHYRFIVHWAQRSKLVKPLSQIVIVNPSEHAMFGLPFESPIDKDHFMWIGFHAQFDAKVLTAWAHSHGGNFVESFLFEAEPSELNILPLDSIGINYPQDSGYPSLDHFRDTLLQQITSDRIRVHARPKYDTVLSSVVRFGGACFTPWSMKEGQGYTLVGFFKKTDPRLATLPTGQNPHHLTVSLLAHTKDTYRDGWGGNLHKWMTPSYEKNFIRHQSIQTLP